MKWKWFILALGILFLSVSVYNWLQRPLQSDVIRKVFGGSNNFETVGNSTDVTAQRMHQLTRTDFDENKNSGRLNGYDLDAPVLVAPAQAAQIRELLESPSSYLFMRGAEKACIADYGVLFNFHSGTQTVRVALCFHCDELAVFAGDNVNQTQAGGEYFDHVHGKFAGIAKSIFPNDPEIQGLKERHR